MESSIYLEDLEFFGTHGLYEFEKNRAQRFLISLRIFGDFSQAMEEDNIAATVDHSAAYAAVKRTVEVNKFNLIERLASEIASNIFMEFAVATGVEVTVRKQPLDWADKNYGSVGFTARFTR
jgi:dihydroneopterin aldolase